MPCSLSPSTCPWVQGHLCHRPSSPCPHTQCLSRLSLFLPGCDPLSLSPGPGGLYPWGPISTRWWLQSGLHYGPSGSVTGARCALPSGSPVCFLLSSLWDGPAVLYLGQPSQVTLQGAELGSTGSRLFWGWHQDALLPGPTEPHLKPPPGHLVPSTVSGSELWAWLPASRGWSPDSLGRHLSVLWAVRQRGLMEPPLLDISPGARGHTGSGCPARTGGKDRPACPLMSLTPPRVGLRGDCSIRAGAGRWLPTACLLIWGAAWSWFAG